MDGGLVKIGSLTLDSLISNFSLPTLENPLFRYSNPPPCCFFLWFYDTPVRFFLKNCLFLILKFCLVAGKIEERKIGVICFFFLSYWVTLIRLNNCMRSNWAGCFRFWRFLSSNGVQSVELMITEVKTKDTAGWMIWIF